MKRLLLTLLAAMAILGPVADGAAWAQERGRGWERREARGAPRGEARARWRDAGPRTEGRMMENRRSYERDRGERRAYRQEGPPDYGPPRGAGIRRGGYMPRDYPGAAVGDYGRYRLRPPPRGYSWYRVPGGSALVSEQSGQIFDMVPDY